MKNSILYYTNNILNHDLLVESLERAIDLSIRHDLNLVVVSHYPLFSDYEEISDLFNRFNVSMRNNEVTNTDNISSYIINEHINCDGKNIVVGDLPRSYLSIICQILIGLEYCTGRVFLFEHDCFYTDEYIHKHLSIGKDFSYFHERTYVTDVGFMDVEKTYYMSGICCIDKVLHDCYINYLEHYSDNLEWGLEPITRGNDLILERKILDSHYQIDSWERLERGSDYYILDFCTELNTTNRLLYNCSQGNTMSRMFISEHSYWGDVKDYQKYFFVDLNNRVRFELMNNLDLKW